MFASLQNLLLGISSNSCSTTAAAGASISELVESSAAQRRALVQGADEPANSVRRAQVLTKVHLPRSRTRVASFMAIEPCVQTEQPLPLDEKQNSSSADERENKTEQPLPLHAEKLESDSVPSACSIYK
jgi:hypothetical protein